MKKKNPLKIQAQQTCGCYQPSPAVWEGERAPKEEEEETAALPLAEEQVWGCQPSAFLCRESGLRKTRRLQKQYSVQPLGCFACLLALWPPRLSALLPNGTKTALSQPPAGTLQNNIALRAGSPA